MSEKKITVEIPERLLWAVAQLVEFDERDAAGNVITSFRPGTQPIVKFEEFRTERRVEEQRAPSGVRR